MQASSAHQTCDLLIRHALILTVDATDAVIEDGAIAIDDGLIVAVGPDRELQARYDARRIIDAQGAAVHPGFIDAHVHVSQYTSRSVLARMQGTSASMGDWKSVLTAEDEAASAALAALDYLKSGYTGFVDPGTIFEPDAVAHVAEQIGIRMWLTDPYVADLAPALARRYPEFANEAFLARWPQNRDQALRRMGSQLFRNRKHRARVRSFIGLYGEGTDSQELLRAALEIASRNGVRVQKHLGYSPVTYREEEALIGRGVLEHLRDEGLLAGHVTFIHMNVVHPSDVALLSSHGVRVVWCPYGQLQMVGRSSAEGRMAELFRAGVAVGIGSDIARATHVHALGTVAAVAAAATGNPLSGREILRMRTVGSAATIGAESSVGSIEVGKCADIVVRKPQASESIGLDPALELGVLSGADSVATVIVDGRIVYEGGHVLTADEGAIVANARGSARSLLSRVLPGQVR
jgi:cytosine/adenosine deaminase-related metal-dependent hydrolase